LRRGRVKVFLAGKRMKGYLFSDALCFRTHSEEKRYPFILKNRGTIIRGKTLAKRGVRD
jgi:hypothetical protein